MMSFIVVLFWFAVTTIVYAYAGYPMLIHAMSKFRPPLCPRNPSEWPDVSVIVCAHNEASNIEHKLKNLTSLDYDSDKLQILVVSDGSTDTTVELARNFERVDVLSYQTQQGKPTAINMAAKAANGEILVFTDARQELSASSIKLLVASLQQPGVGVVSGLLVQDLPTDEEDARSNGLYWRYEKSVRLAESRFDSIPGATGALYAIRKQHFTPVMKQTILDDVELPMNVVRAGLRSVLEPRALAHDVVANSNSEMARKIRTLTGNFQLIAQQPWLMSPRRNRLFFQFFSHKVLRLLVPYMLVVVAVAPFYLGGPYSLTIPLQAAFYLLAIAGLQSEKLRSRLWPVNVAYLLIALNVAAVRAFGRFVGARYSVKWKAS